MDLGISGTTEYQTAHPWWRQVRVSMIPGPMTSLLEVVFSGLLNRFRQLGHIVQEAPDDTTDLLLTSAPFGEPLGWRKALLFSARKRFKLRRTPTIVTLLHARLKRFAGLLEHIRSSLERDPIDPSDFDFPGMAPLAHRVLIEQGRRGGPLLTLERMVQAQAKSIRAVVVVGDDLPKEAYTFDLVGAHPRTPADDLDAFYKDIALRLVTAMSTSEVTNHAVVGEPVSRLAWEKSRAPEAMAAAGKELGRRLFFTEMVRIADLVHVPAVSRVVASQYSEGCFATWDPAIGGLVTTVTGSARPVDKTSIGDDDLAVIVGVQPDASGALIRQVEGSRNDPPSSEAVELIEMDGPLPRVQLDEAWGVSAEVPVVRSKLHGHRGVGSFNPKYVEHVTLEPAYYHFPVSCATDGQARAIKSAFSRSQALQNPEDPRQVVFTMLPGHGTVIAEKWVPGKDPFQVIWEYMDAGHLEVENMVPQGPLQYVPAPNGTMVLQET